MAQEVACARVLEGGGIMLPSGDGPGPKHAQSNDFKESMKKNFKFI